MRTPRDVYQYGANLRDIRDLQTKHDGPVFKEYTSPQLTLEQQAELERFRAGDIHPRELSLAVRMWVGMESMNERRRNPLFYSDLPVLLEQETWAPTDAMLILAGVDPHAAIVKWDYENFMGARVNSPKIQHANWFASAGDLYDWPVPGDFEYTSSEIKSLIKKAEEGSSEAERKELFQRLEEAEKWENDETSQFKRAMLSARAQLVGILKRRWESGDHDPNQRRAPAFFVRWAETRGFEVEWAAWAREHDYLDQEPPAAAAPYFDADAEDYPRLLHVAVRAWEHAREGTGGTAKQRIAAYLLKSYPELSGGERDAIAMIGNWQKSGGRPKTVG